MLAIVGGSGFGRLPQLDGVRNQVVRSPFGNPSGPLQLGKILGEKVVFLARHGVDHTLPPHKINYRANLWALKAVGATRILAVVTVGGIGKRYFPGTLAVPHQIIDLTWGRRHTFFDEGGPVRHIDFTEPYSAEMRSRILSAAKACSEEVLDAGVYAATQGPRLETAAEIDSLERQGADMVGMTGMPEASLAREIGLPYGAIAVVVNHAAGRGDSRVGIDLDAITAVHKTAMARVGKIISEYLGDVR